MLWRLGVVLLALTVTSLGHADSISIDDSAPGQAPEEDGTDEQPDDGDSQEIGGVVGVGMGGNLTPGGIAAEGRYLYRLSELDWLETSVHFRLGGGGKECFRDRQSTFVCEHGLADGFSAQGSLGLRRYFTGQKQFRPFVRAGAGLELISFADDGVTGLGLPLYLGSGIRVEVANRVLVVVDATLRAGPSILNKGLGLEPSLSLSVAAGVEFNLE